MASEAQATTEEAPRVGAMVKHYELVRELGQGGMGTVYLARDTRLGRLVAIKVVASGSERFRVEAQATARCRHDNIVVIHEVDHLPGHLYMVLEYLEGRTLREWMTQRERATTDERVAPSLAVELMIPVVRALACAHQLGIVHRDLKPENIFLTDAGRVVVLDFGIAKRLDASELSALDRGSRPGARLTQDGALLGTLPYMSPEQLRADEVDARTDLWTVGIVLFELVAGGHPLAHCSVLDLLDLGESDAAMPRVAEHRPDVGPLGAVIDRCLEKARDDRYGSAAELLAALERLGAATLDGDDCPFAGLAAFQEADAERYVGRAPEIAGLIRQLRNQALVVVTGPSGAGKSSFVRAGVIPALKRSGERWDAVLLRPGRRPLAQLAEAIGEPADALAAQPGLAGARLRGRGRRLVVFVDQFEELYTLGADAAERAAFVACLEAIADDASSPLRVVLALRSDFLDRLAADGHLLAETARGLWFLRPMARDGLREALVRPLEAVGYRFERDALIDAILDGLAPTKSPLPLLQFTAARLWDARDRDARCLTQASYDAGGGVAGALSAHANAVLASLSAAEQVVCRAVMVRLCTPERTRAVVGLAELGPAAEQVCRRLADARLVVIEAGGDGVTVELCHESLIERWDKLGHWLAEGQLDRQLEARLETAARQWEAGHYAEGLLWRDRPAQGAIDWLARRRATGAPLPRREERFLAAVAALARRRRARRRRIILLLASAVVAALVLAIALAINVRRRAIAAQQEARESRNAARMAAARELSQRDPTTMLVLLREIEPPGVAHGWAELASTAMQSGLAREVRAWPSVVYHAAWSPDGRRVVASFEDATARIWTVGDPASALVLRGHTAAVLGAAFSPDGTRVVTASDDATVRIWASDGTGEPRVLRGHTARVWSAMFSPDGARIVSASVDGTARVWRVDGTAPPIVLRGHGDAVAAASFSPDGTRVVTASYDRTARIWNADGSGEPVVLRGHEGLVVAASFSPDGRRIVTGSDDRTARVWNADGSGEPIVLRGHEGQVRTALFSPDGKRALTASPDRTARIWNADGSGEPLVLRGHDHWIFSAAWSPDGASIVTASSDRTTRVLHLDLLDAAAPLLFRGHELSILDVAFSADRQHLATVSSDKTGRIWRRDATGAPVLLLGHTDTVRSVAFSHDDRHVVTAADDATARIWRTDGAGPPIVLRGHGGPIHTASFSQDDELVVTSSEDHTARLWRSDGTGSPVVLRGHEQPLSAAVFSPDGRRVATSSEDRTVRVWNRDGRGEPRVYRTAGHDIRSIAWDPGGTRLVIASQDPAAVVWRVDDPGPPELLRGHEGPVSWASWSPDGLHLVTASEDGTARVWSGVAPRTSVVLRGHDSDLLTAVFSADSKRIITTSEDETVRVWNADGTGEPYVLSLGEGQSVYYARVDADGGAVFSAAPEKVGRLYPLGTPFTGPDDPRLWAATPDCLTVERRVALLGIAAARAREDQAACEQRRYKGLATGRN